MNKKPTYIDNEETLMSLLKKRFKLNNDINKTKSKIHYCIAVGDHIGTEVHAKILKDLNHDLSTVLSQIDNHYNSQKLQTL